MNAIAARIKRHVLPIYFALTFAISWGCMLMVIVFGDGGLVPSEEQAEDLLPFAVAALVAGPIPAGLVCTALADGRPGLREVASRLLRWRVDARWYALAFFGAPLAGIAVLFVLLPASSQFLPGIIDTSDRASLVLAGVGVGMVAGVFEEVGWTGFATPRLRLRYGILGGGLILGFLWGAWHYIVAVWGSGDPSGGFSTSLFLAQFLFYVAVLPPFRVLMVWVHERTGSLLVAIVMHASLTGNVLYILMPPDISNWPLLIWYAGMAAVLWFVVAVAAWPTAGRSRTVTSSAQQ